MRLEEWTNKELYLFYYGIFAGFLTILLTTLVTGPIPADGLVFFTATIGIITIVLYWRCRKEKEATGHE